MTTQHDRLEGLLHVADLLLGAAYSDERLAAQEEQAVRRLLAGLLNPKAGPSHVPPPPLPSGIEERIRQFDRTRFEVRATAAKLSGQSRRDKRKLLELISTVTAADGELDLEEDAYLRTVAEALGLPASEYKDLVLEVVSDEELHDFASALFAAAE